MNAQEPNIVMTVKEVSEYLRIAESTVYRLVQEGEMPGKKVGGVWRFSKQGIEIWLRELNSSQTNENEV
ncbi:MAG: helix-turn-helix domain-containing protein [Anaerolineales bacterium]|nr:helix-turn-helix domain-containing protein [Anaerolineales bacterium]